MQVIESMLMSSNVEGEHAAGRECHHRGEVFLRPSHREEDGGLHGVDARRVLRISSHAALQSQQLEAERLALHLLTAALGSKVSKLTFSSADLYEAYNWNYNAANDPDEPDSSIAEINLWPENLPQFKETLCAYQSEMISFARKLTRTFALALHLPEKSFDDMVKRPEAGVRIVHYPRQEASRDDQNGIGAHTDVEYFTIITADTEGLEVLSKSGRWIKVKPIPGSFVVNIADCFMRQTNDFFVSTVHRVINESGRERYSVPFFWGLNRQTVLDPIPTCVSEECPNKYPIMTAGEYYLWRTRRQKTSWVTGEGTKQS